MPMRMLIFYQIVSACHYPPVATSALLTYEICKLLHPDIVSSCAFLCAMGTHGDLGTTLKWKPPFPDMAETFKQYSKKAINDAVSLINARKQASSSPPLILVHAFDTSTARRTAKFDVISAWEALLAAKTPKDLLTNSRLLEARAEINDEVERHTHAAPKFSKDGKIAVLRINSGAQVHPVIATRWVPYLLHIDLFHVTQAKSFTGRPPSVKSPRNRHGSQLWLLSRSRQLLLSYRPLCPFS